jgi:rare lipoprotein A
MGVLLFAYCTAAPRYTHSTLKGDSARAAADASAVNDSDSGNVATGRFHQTGSATYYSDKFQGRKTASGERYDRALLTAAHRSLPFGTMVRVTNLGNNRSVTVRINDRGPHKRSRIIDLSAAAARQIGMLRSGVARVGIEIVGR